MIMPDLSLVLGVDQKTAEQLQITIPTWAKYRPELFRQPWIVFFDREQLQPQDLRDILTPVGKTQNVRAIPWPIVPTEYANQREKMLTGFCHVCRWVETDWWAKIDTDAVALREDDWLPAEWFSPSPDNRQHNVIIASPWSYTKPAGQMAELDNWGDTVPGLREHPRLDLPFDPKGKRCRHPRIASWVSYYRAEWSRMAADMALHYAGPCKLPVPSQDGFHFYVARRRGDQMLRANQKRRGWTNCPRLEGLKKTAEKALRGDFRI